MQQMLSLEPFLSQHAVLQPDQMPVYHFMLFLVPAIVYQVNFLDFSIEWLPSIFGVTTDLFGLPSLFFSFLLIPGYSMMCCQCTQVDILNKTYSYWSQHINNVLAGKEEFL